MVRTGHVSGKTPSVGAGEDSLSATAKKKGGAAKQQKAAAAASSSSASKVANKKKGGAAKSPIAAEGGVKKKKAKRVAVFSLAPFRAFLHERADAIYESGLFADQLADNAIGKSWVTGEVLAKKRAKGSINKILFAGDVPAMIRAVVERAILARMISANRLALGRRRRLDGTLAKRSVHVTGADLRMAKEVNASMFSV